MTLLGAAKKVNPLGREWWWPRCAGCGRWFAWAKWPEDPLERCHRCEGEK